MSKIKICGLRRIEDVDYVNRFRPDYAGFVFANSKRRVTKEQARELRNHLVPEIVPVGVFVNEDVKVVAELVNQGIIELAQLHGDEDEAYIRQLRKLIGNHPIIKAVRVATKGDVDSCERIPVDYLLFDSFSLQAYGGTGQGFDWSLIQQVQKPFFLAGGIGVDNVQKAVEETRPFGVDVSSGVETDGFKDPKKIARMVRSVRIL